MRCLPPTTPHNDEDKDFLTSPGKKRFGVSEQREATLRGHPRKFRHSVAAKRCPLSGCGVAMVSLFWFSSCRWEDASSRAQVSVPIYGLLVNSVSRRFFSFFSLYFLPFLFHLDAPPLAPRRFRVIRKTIFSSFDVSNFTDLEMKRRRSSRQPASRLPPSLTSPFHLRAPVSTWSGKIKVPRCAESN